MNRIRPESHRCGDQRVAHQITLRRGRRTDVHRLISLTYVWRARVGVAVHGDAPDAELTARANYPESDLAAIGYQDLREHLRRLQRDVAVLLRRIAVALSLQRLERSDQHRPCVPRIDDVIEVSSAGRDVRVSKLRAVLLDLLVRCAGRICAFTDLLAEENLNSALRSHHRNLRGGPRDVVISAYVLRAHHVVRTTIRLSRYHCQLGHRGFAVSIQELCAMLDDASVLLSDAR